METDLSLGPAPAVTDAAAATIMRRAGELLRVLAKHLLDGSDSGRQTEALKGTVHILPSRLNPHSPDNVLSFGVTCAIQI